MALTFDRPSLLAVVEIHVHAKFHQAECSGSSVIMLTEKTNKKTNCHYAENNIVVAVLTYRN